MEVPLESAARARRTLFLSAFMTLSIMLVGLTLIVGAGSVLMVRAYVTIGERMADLSGPDMETTPGGIFAVVKELAAGPGIHKPMFWGGSVLTIAGVGLTIAHIVVRRTLKRRTQREIARVASDLRAQREQRSARGG